MNYVKTLIKISTCQCQRILISLMESDKILPAGFKEDLVKGRKLIKIK